jgi:hypothetical protein
MLCQFCVYYYRIQTKEALGEILSRLVYSNCREVLFVGLCVSKRMQSKIGLLLGDAYIDFCSKKRGLRKLLFVSTKNILAVLL